MSTIDDVMVEGAPLQLRDVLIDLVSSCEPNKLPRGYMRPVRPYSA